jgi:uncharacterized membrane protein
MSDEAAAGEVAPEPPATELPQAPEERPAPELPPEAESLEARRGTEFSPERLEAFSDGVMAVIITIMAFELKAPLGSSFVALRHQLPALLVYILSFVFIGIYWNNHHHLLRLTPRINGAVMWSNLVVLFWLSLVPVLTEWVAAQYSQQLPAAAYGVVDLGAAVSYLFLVRAIIRANADSHVAEAIGSDTKGRVSIALYAAGIGLAAVEPWLAYSVYVLVSLMWFVPDRRLAR